MAEATTEAAPTIEGPTPSLVEVGGAPSPAPESTEAPVVSAEPSPPPATATSAEGEAAPPVEPAPSTPTEAPAGTPDVPTEPSSVAASEAPVEPGSEGAVEPRPEAPAEPAPTAEAAQQVQPGAQQPEAQAQQAEPKPPLTYEPFTLPEGMTVNDTLMGDYTKVLGEAQVPQEVGQSLIDLHGRVMREAVAAEVQRQRDVWDQTQRDWRTQVQAEFGNQYDTKLNDARWAVMQLAPNEDVRKELWGVLSFTGAGNHPAVVRFLADTAKKLRERPSPPPPTPPRPAATNPWDRRYSNGSGLVER